jgi:hypothetical protein
LKPAFKPAATRRACLAACDVPVAHDATGTYGEAAVERKKFSASVVPSKNGRPSLWAGTPSIRSSPSPNVSDCPWPCGSQVSTT